MTTSKKNAAKEPSLALTLDDLVEFIQNNIPQGFEYVHQKMHHWVVPKSLYPPGYHCTPDQPLPFLSLAKTASGISLYHMGLYADERLEKWFREAYDNLNMGKLDMGKSCVRFKKVDKIPINLLGALLQKMTPEQWIELYEKNLKKSAK